jgi:hypothetical protein
MRAERLLFARSSIWAGLAPILVALLLLVSLSIAGFAIAFWPGDSAPSAHLSGESEAMPASRSFEGEARRQPDAHEPRSRKTWM